MKSYILIDKSGSMGRNWEETLGAVNGYVEDLAADKDTKKTKVTIAAFDAGHDGLDFEVVRRKMKANDFVEVTERDVYPRGMTPLYDAISQMNAMILDDGPKQATLIVVTDGAENASRECDKASAGKMLEAMREKGWDVTFIGADFNNMTQARGLGNDVGSTIQMKAGSYRGAMEAMASKTAFYASHGVTRAFSDDERATANGE